MKQFFGKLYKFVKILVIVAVIALIIKALALDAFKIPSASMENTLQPGDFIIANKFAYQISTPHEIPILGLPIPYANIYKMGEPKLGDVVVFEFPHGFESDNSNSNPKYVKRIVAGPHDTLKIVKGNLYVNGELLILPSTLKISELDDKNTKDVEIGIYPPGAKWNRYNYGPIIIPAKGDTIRINPGNFKRWQPVIVTDYGARTLLEEGTIVTLDGSAISEYVLKQDHYFVVGDNPAVSMDSRHFGCITDDMIIGKALLIYWSYDSEKIAPGPLGFLSAIRANRLFKIVD